MNVHAGTNVRARNAPNGVRFEPLVHPRRTATRAGQRLAVAPGRRCIPPERCPRSFAPAPHTPWPWSIPRMTALSIPDSAAADDAYLATPRISPASIKARAHIGLQSVSGDGGPTGSLSATHAMLRGAALRATRIASPVRIEPIASPPRLRGPTRPLLPLRPERTCSAVNPQSVIGCEIARARFQRPDQRLTLSQRSRREVQRITLGRQMTDGRVRGMNRQRVHSDVVCLISVLREVGGEILLVRLQVLYE